MTLTKNVKAESEQNKPDGVLYASIIENSEKMPQWLCLSARAPVPIPQTRWLQVQKFICSRFWRLEVGDQGINTVGIFQRPLLAFSRAILSVCPQVAFPVCVCVSWSPPLTGTAVLVESGHPDDLLFLYLPLSGPHVHIRSHALRDWGLELQQRGLGGTQLSP